MELTLNDEERAVLTDILEADLSDLREEIYKTERYELKQELKRREEIIKDLLQRLAPITI